MKTRLVSKLFIYFTIIAIAGPFFDNWTSTEKILFMSDAYVRECHDSEVLGPPTSTFRCTKQQLEVSNLLSYARMSEFLTSVAIGICVDRFGPRIVCCIGVLLSILSWGLLAFFPKYGPMLKLSMIFIGASTNATLFPAITIESYTKKHKVQIMIFICSASSITCLLVKFVEVFLRSTRASPQTMALVVILPFLLPCLVASFIFFPNNLKEDVKRVCRVSEEELVLDKINYNELSKKVSIISLSSLRDLRMSRSLSKTKSQDGKHPREERLDEAREEPSNSGLTTKTSSIKDGEGPRLSSEKEKSTEKWNWKGFLGTVKSFQVILLTLYYCLNVVAITFTQQSYTIIYSDNSFLLQFAEYFLPFSFIPCIVFMLLTKFASTHVLVLIIGFLWSLLNLSSLVKSQFMGVVTAVLFTISYSIYNAHVYVYIERAVNKDYYSSVLGFLNTVGGLSLLINLFLLKPMTDFKSMANINIALLALRLPFLAIIVFLFVKELRQKRLEEAKKEQA